jgi:hypothetical protein
MIPVEIKFVFHDKGFDVKMTEGYNLHMLLDASIELVKTAYGLLDHDGHDNFCQCEKIFKDNLQVAIDRVTASPYAVPIKIIEA